MTTEIFPARKSKTFIEIIIMVESLTLDKSIIDNFRLWLPQCFKLYRFQIWADKSAHSFFFVIFIDDFVSFLEEAL